MSCKSESCPCWNAKSPNNCASVLLNMYERCHTMTPEGQIVMRSREVIGTVAAKFEAFPGAIFTAEEVISMIHYVTRGEK